MALPVFALLIVAEVLYTRSQGHNAYALKDFAGSMSQLGINSLVRLAIGGALLSCLLYTSPSPRDATLSRMPSSA